MYLVYWKKECNNPKFGMQMEIGKEGNFYCKCAAHFFFLKKEAQNCSLGASGAFKNDD